jgi:protein phosphatase
MSTQESRRERNAKETVLRIPPSALIVLIGPAASGKSTWATKHFRSTQIVSSDQCRALIADDEADQEASRDAFRIFHRIINERLKRGLLTVADSTALTATARADLLRSALVYNRPTVAVVFMMPAEVQRQWNQSRSRHVPAAVLSEHRQMAQQMLNAICNEGFNQITILHSPADSDAMRICVGPVDAEHDDGPFDIIGDVHGCYDELCDLLAELGYVNQGNTWGHPEQRTLVFVGDLADRGPNSLGVWQLVLGMAEAGRALIVPGNHDNKFMRWLLGRPIRAGRGLTTTLSQFEALSAQEQTVLRERILALLRAAPSYLLLDHGQLVVTHAGIRDDMIGRWDRQISAFCLYGDVAGYDQEGIPIRRHWALERRVTPHSPLIVYGHVVVDSPAFQNETVDIDTGCCFGGSLTALRYPERTFVNVTARQVYADRGEDL